MPLHPVPLRLEADGRLLLSPVPLRLGTYGRDCKSMLAACLWLALSLVLQTTNQLRHPFAKLRFKSRTFGRDTCLGTTARLQRILGLYLLRATTSMHAASFAAVVR